MKKMMNRLNRREGFTLAELLIVVAIIAVLVAISIPIFTSQLERARQGTNQANIRAAYAQAQSCVLLQSDGSDAQVTFVSGFDKEAVTGDVSVSGVTIVKTSKAYKEYDNATWPGGIAADSVTGTLADNQNATVTFTYSAGKLTAIAIS